MKSRERIIFLTSRRINNTTVTMLEEDLRNEKSSPTETATKVLDFVQSELAAGGSAASGRFSRFFPDLCDRIFGAVSDKKDDYRHKEGWLAAQSSSTTTTSLPASSPRLSSNFLSAHTTSLASSNDVIVTLLGTSSRTSSSNDSITLPTLLEAIVQQSEARIELHTLSFFALPTATQQAWLRALDMSGGHLEQHSNESSLRLFGELLRCKPSDQRDLIRLRQQGSHNSPVRANEHSQFLSASPRGFTKTLSWSSPTSKASSTSPENTQAQEDPKVWLNMLEYYLLLFVRYPLYAYVHFVKPGTRPPAYPSHGDRVYSELFNQYIRFFLPYYTADKSDAYTITASPRDCEIFLRLIIVLWIESDINLTTTTRIMQSITDKSRGPTARLPRFDLHDSYTLVQGHYMPSCRQVLSCLTSFVEYCILNPELKKRVFRYNNSNKWCLTEVMTELQQPLYNLIRGSLKNATVHSYESPFYQVLNIWLMWLEPWNVVTGPPTATSKRGTEKYSVPSYSSSSRYISEWEPYVAANAYMYAVPLAIFLRRSRELDFSMSKFSRSIQTVRRVLRVFSPNVVKVLSKSLSEVNGLTRHHATVLGDYAPPKGPISFDSCQTDMQALLEEIYTSKTKHLEGMSFLDRLGARIEDTFGQVSTISGESQALEKLIEQARPIVGWSLDYQVISNGDGKAKTKKTSDTDSELSKYRLPNGKLTEEGRQLLLSGQLKNDVTDMPYLGDKMFIRTKTNEIDLLVKATTWLSVYLNEKIGIEKSSRGPLGFRFNLRFLADYRVLSTIVFIFLIRKVI